MRLLLPLLLMAASAHSEISGTTFISEDWKLQMDFPSGWRLVESPNYPQVILWAAAPLSDAQLVLTAEPLTVAPENYAKNAAKQLTLLGFNVRGPRLRNRPEAVVYDVTRPGHFGRMAIIVDKKRQRVISLALISQSNSGIRANSRAFDITLRSYQTR